MDEIKEGDVIGGKRVARVLKWKVHYDTQTKKPCGTPSGTTGSLVCVADEGGQLPLLVNKPHWVRDREAILIIFSK